MSYIKPITSTVHRCYFDLQRIFCTPFFSFFYIGKTATKHILKPLGWFYCYIHSTLSDINPIISTVHGCNFALQRLFYTNCFLLFYTFKKCVNCYRTYFHTSMTVLWPCVNCILRQKTNYQYHTWVQLWFTNVTLYTCFLPFLHWNNVLKLIILYNGSMTNFSDLKPIISTAYWCNFDFKGKPLRTF